MRIIEDLTTKELQQLRSITTVVGFDVLIKILSKIVAQHGETVLGYRQGTDSEIAGMVKEHIGMDILLSRILGIKREMGKVNKK